MIPVARTRVSAEHESVALKIASRSGSKLGKLSYVGDHEDEVLLMPGTRLLVTSIDRHQHSLVDAHTCSGTVIESVHSLWHVQFLAAREWSRSV